MVNPADVQEGYGGLEGGRGLHVPTGNNGGGVGGAPQTLANNNSWWKKFCGLFTMDCFGGYVRVAEGEGGQVPASNCSWWKKFLPTDGRFFSELGELERLLDGLASDYSEEDNVVVDGPAANDVVDGPAANDKWWTKVFPLGRHCSVSDNAFGACMETIAIAMVMAVLTLNIYSATYFLAWAKDSSICIVVPEPHSNIGSSSDLPEPFKIVLKIAAVGLPFTFVPLTICIAGTAKASKKSGRGLGFVAGLVLGEVAYVLVLGGLMTICMSNADYKVVGGVTFGLIAGLVWIWGCVFNHPKCLRGCVYPSCCCPEYDLEVGGVEVTGGWCMHEGRGG